MVTADIPAFRNILNLTQLVARPRLGRKTFQSCPTHSPLREATSQAVPRITWSCLPPRPQGVGGLSPRCPPKLFRRSGHIHQLLGR